MPEYRRHQFPADTDLKPPKPSEVAQVSVADYAAMVLIPQLLTTLFLFVLRPLFLFGPIMALVVGVSSLPILYVAARGRTHPFSVTANTMRSLPYAMYSVGLIAALGINLPMLLFATLRLLILAIQLTLLETAVMEIRSMIVHQRTWQFNVLGIFSVAITLACLMWTWVR